MINSRVKAIIVFFAALTWSNLAIADEEFGLVDVYHIHELIGLACAGFYGEENTHINMLSADVSNVLRFCAYVSHPVEDMGALCHQFFGEPSKARGSIQRLCARLQQLTKHELPPDPLGVDVEHWYKNARDSLGMSNRAKGLDALGLDPLSLPKFPPIQNPQKLWEHLGDGLGSNPSLPSRLPDHPMSSPLPSNLLGDSHSFNLSLPPKLPDH